MSEQKHIINLELVDFTKEPMFFGKSLNLQRYDKVKNPIFYDLYLKQLSFSWRPEEVDIQKDRGDFNTLSEHEKFIFTKNLSYQILLDSIQSRGGSKAFDEGMDRIFGEKKKKDDSEYWAKVEAETQARIAAANNNVQK